jgi:hypothetical protein
MHKNFSQKGFTANFLSFMKDLERNKLCCLDFLTQVYTTDSDTVTFTGLGTKSSPLIATASGFGAQPANTFFAGPASGASAIPTFRPLVASDIPPPLVNNGLSVNSSSIGWGQPVGAAGNPAALLENRQVPLNNFSIDFTNGSSQLSMDMLGFANSFRLLSTTYFTVGSETNYFIVQGAQAVAVGSFPVLQLTHASTNQGELHTWAGVIEGFNWGDNVHAETLLITTTPASSGAGPAGDILLSTGRIQQTNYGTRTTIPYNIAFQPSGTGYVQSTANFAIAGTYPSLTPPTAKIHIMDASTGAAGTGPIKLTPGVLLTVLDLGVLEFTDDGTTGHLYITLNQAGVLTRVQIV